MCFVFFLHQQIHANQNSAILLANLKKVQNFRNEFAGFCAFLGKFESNATFSEKNNFQRAFYVFGKKYLCKDFPFFR